MKNMFFGLALLFFIGCDSDSNVKVDVETDTEQGVEIGLDVDTTDESKIIEASNEDNLITDVLGGEDVVSKIEPTESDENISKDIPTTIPVEVENPDENLIEENPKEDILEDKNISDIIYSDFEENNTLTEDNPTASENSNLYITSNELIFGTGDLEKTVNFSNGDFGELLYSENITDDIFNISFSLENIQTEQEYIETSFIFRVDEVGSSKLLIVVFPKVRILKDGTIDSSNLDIVQVYGLRSSGTPVGIESKIIGSSYIYSTNGKIFIDFSKSIDSISQSIGTEFSMDSYLGSNNILKFSFALTNIDNLADGKDMTEILLTDLLGDMRINVERKIVDSKTFGVYGTIEVRK